MNCQKIFNKIAKYKYVSFDIFDTLLKRDVYIPTDVFDIIARKYEIKNQQTIDFKLNRIRAEKDAKAKSTYSDITLDEIYSELNCSDFQKNELKNFELETESELLHVNSDLKRIYDECLKQGKQIFIVSDMYLSKSFLEDILKREGFTKYKGLYISCEYRANKRSGILFKVLCEHENIKSKDLIHIGDSIYADFIGPKRIGAHAIHIKRFSNKTLYSNIHTNDTINKKIIFSFINNRLHKDDVRSFRLGYEVLGPIIYAYCRWIHDAFSKLKKSQYESILWFAARDMFLFEKAYRILFRYSDDLEYVYISRKSLRPILTTTTNDITESGNVFARGKYTLADLIKYMGYTPKNISDQQFDLTKKYDVRTLKQYPEVVKILSSSYIIKCEEERGSVGLQYLKEHGFLKKHIVLADVGWHGTTQYILGKILQTFDRDKTIKGLYLGSLDGTDDKIGKDKYKSFLFDEYSDSPLTKGIILFETLILAPHGTTNGYERLGNTVHPVLGQPDNLVPYVSEVQEGALRFVEDFANSPLSQLFVYDGNCVSDAFGRLSVTPRKEELNDIGQLDYDNFYKNKLAFPKSIFYYLIHPNSLYTDLKYAPWRIGFMYKLFKVRFPYAKIYSCIRKKMGKQA